MGERVDPDFIKASFQHQKCCERDGQVSYRLTAINPDGSFEIDHPRCATSGQGFGNELVCLEMKRIPFSEMVEI